METVTHFYRIIRQTILSPGGIARIPELKGLGDLPLFTLKSFAEMEEIIDLY